MKDKNEQSVENPSWSQLFGSPTLFSAFGFGSGLFPVAPGTAGTVLAVPIYLLMAKLPLAIYLAVVIFSFLIGVYLCEKSSKALGVHDHKGIVWDEFVGYWITMIAAPTGWHWVLLGFVFFRFFDMVKPWPISIADKKIHGGFGIMFDDVLAGLAALACVQGLSFGAWF